MHAIHEARIVHSDLKPANFLVVEGRLKLIDFGIAKAISSDTTSIARESQARRARRSRAQLRSRALPVLACLGLLQQFRLAALQRDRIALSRPHRPGSQTWWAGRVRAPLYALQRVTHRGCPCCGLAGRMHSPC